MASVFSHFFSGYLKRYSLLGVIWGLILLTGMSPAHGQSPGGTEYLKAGSGWLQGTFLPRTEGGHICYSCLDEIGVKIDEKRIPYDVTPHNDGTASFGGRFDSVTDGPHVAAAEGASHEASEGAAVKRVYFLVDTKPPELELAAPEGNTIATSQASFLVRFRDDGSGISAVIPEMGVEGEINGRDADLQVNWRGGDRYLVITSPEGMWRPGQRVSLHVRVKDRAGNSAELNKSFHTADLREEWDLETVRCPGHASPRGVYLLKRVPFPILATPKNIVFDSNKRSALVEISIATLMGRPLDRSIFDAVMLKSDHPAVAVRRVETPVGSSSARFEVIQSKKAVGEAGLCLLRVEHPEAVAFDYEVSCKEGEATAKVKGMSPSGPAVRYTIPVYLYWESQFFDQLVVEDGLLKYRCHTGGSGDLDPAASWFEMEGGRYWIGETGAGTYEARIPGVREGYHIYSVRLTSLRGRWVGIKGARVTQSGTRLDKEGEVFVKLAPPVIEDFRYHRGKEKFTARISDKGTAMEDLVLRLSMGGGGEITAELDPETGLMEAPCPLPPGIRDAELIVTDMAGQRARKTCKVFGKVPVSRQAGGGITYKAGTGQWNNIPPEPGPGVTREYLNISGGMQRVRECRSAAQMDLSHPFISCVNRLVHLGKSHEEACQECRKKGFSAVHRTYRGVARKCTDLWLDTLAPRVRNIFYNSGTGEVSALIDDHGRSLSELNIRFYAKGDSFGGNPYESKLPYTFDRGTGAFKGRFMPFSLLERFQVTIAATDSAGNKGHGWLDITAPRNPPDLELEVINPGEIISPAGTVSVCLLGEYHDASGIDYERTRVWIDDRAMHPFRVIRDWGTGGGSVYFGARLKEGRHRGRISVTDKCGLSSEKEARFRVSFTPRIRDFRVLPNAVQMKGGPAFMATVTDLGGNLQKEGLQFMLDSELIPADRLFYDPTSGYFAVDGPLEIGPWRHAARLTATDEEGNRAEASLSFVPGGKVEIPEMGPDELTVEKVNLWELSDHNGDGKANPGELVRMFVTLRNNAASDLEGVVARLSPEEELMSVETDRVEYGRIGSGEAAVPVRGFDIRIDEAILDTTAHEPFEAPFRLEVVSSGSTWSFPLNLLVYRPTIPVFTASSDPSTVSVRIERLPASTDQEQIEITGEASSSGSTIERVVVYVNGDARDAEWDEERGRFWIRVPLEVGDNLIEVQAMDRSGAIGSANVYIFRTEPVIPPEIEISSPGNGAAYFCIPVYLHGTFGTGSSELESIHAEMTGDDGITVSLPLRIGEEKGEEEGEGAGSVFYHDGRLPFPPGWEDNRVTTVRLTVFLVTKTGVTATKTVTFTVECRW